MIKETIQNINDIIINSGLVERYGKYCNHKTDGTKIPFYGVGIEKDCKGNTYTFDERVTNVAYLEFLPFKTTAVNSLINNFDFTFNIHHFVSTKKVNDNRYYGKHLELFQAVFNAIKAVKTFNKSQITTVSITNNIPDHCEYGVISISFSQYVDCNYVPETDPALC